MRKLFSLLLALAVVIAAACRKESPAGADKKNVPGQTSATPQDASNAKVKEVLPVDVPVLERSALGTKLDKDGNVIESADTFKPGEPIHVTMWLNRSPEGLQTSVRFIGADGKDADWPKKEMKGEKIVTLTTTKKLTPGEYHAKCFWGMNEECDYTFTVEGAGKKKR